MKHRDEDISIDEAPSFKEESYTVDGNGRMVYKASSRHGKSFATEPQRAVDGAKEQIDRAKDGVKDV